MVFLNGKSRIPTEVYPSLDLEHTYTHPLLSKYMTHRGVQLLYLGLHSQVICVVILSQMNVLDYQAGSQIIP